MKRPIPSFTVEVRRRPGRAASPAVNAAPFETKPSFESKPRRPEFDRDTDRAIAAIFGPRAESLAPVATPPPAPAPTPTGRVLTSLVVDRPLSDGFDSELSRVFETREGQWGDEEPAPRPRSKGPSRSKSPRKAAAAIEPPPSASSQRPAMTVEPAPGLRIGNAIKVSPPAKSTPESLVKNASPVAAFAKTKKLGGSYVNGKNRTPARPPELPNLAKPVAVSKASAAIDREEAEAPRRRKIMGRYVYGDEPKPGERWKHRLRKKW